MTQRYTDQELKELIDTAVAGIVKDIREDDEIKHCTSLEEVAEFRDVNCLGGMCEDDHWIWTGHDPEVGMAEYLVEAHNKILTLVDNELQKAA
jgi:hypothetical protein